MGTSLMTVTVDAQKRVRLRLAQPGERFDVKPDGEGRLLLTKLEPVQARPAKVSIQKSGRFTVGVLDRPIDLQALKEAISEFP
jgi:hypothetical protein